MRSATACYRGEGGRKKELIATAIQISEASAEVVRLAKLLAKECTDKRMRTVSHMVEELNVCLKSVRMRTVSNRGGEENACLKSVRMRTVSNRVEKRMPV